MRLVRPVDGGQYPAFSLLEVDGAAGVASRGLNPDVVERAFAQQPAPSAPQGEFVPVKELPQHEELPAAPLVIAAYGFVWVALLVY
jgi:hypothetical protein